MIFFVNRQLIRRLLNDCIKNQKLNQSQISYQTKLNNLKIPGFKVNSKDVIIITEPNEFHSKLLNLIQLSKKRIVLSSLYIGTGELEKNLINKLNDQLKLNKELKATILLDYNRGNREDKNGESSRKILIPLLKNNDNLISKSNDTNNLIDNQHKRISIDFFLSPDFSNPILKKALLNRQKYNEIISLQHIKIYLFDNDFIISGANLNEQYFTNRQDRYIYIRNCPQLADYLEQLIKQIGNISMHLNSDGTFSFELDPLDDKNKKKIHLKLKDNIDRLNEEYRLKLDNQNDNNQTFIYPLLQMKKFKINTDEKFTKFIINNLNQDSRLFLASGYFNLTKDYQRSLFRTASKKPNCLIELIMASEQVNSFYKANGPIKHIPSVYTELSRNFLENLNSKMLTNIKLLSYIKDNWTFHAKGLWLLNTNKADYFLSLIGSPNFGYRSVYKDLELQFVILTKDDYLIQNLLNEYENIRKHSLLISKTDQLPFVSYWIRIATKFLKSYF